MINDVCGLERIRFLTSHPSFMSDPILEAVAGLPAPRNHPSADTGLAALRARTGGLKHVFLFVLGQVWDTLDAARLLDPSHQPYLAGLADIAMETYLAESTVLRVSKRCDRTTDGALEAETALARIVFFRATERIRQEATELLGSLLEGERLTAALARIAAWLPVPVGLVDSRAQVARALVARGGWVQPAAF